MGSRRRYVFFTTICCYFVSLLLHGGNSQASPFQNLVELQNKTMSALSQKFLTNPQTNWRTNSSNPCDWHGVDCSSGQVVRLSLSSYGISTNNSSAAAEFVDLLCRLGSLTSLDLSKNSISIIPNSSNSTCNVFSELKYLNLSSNSLAGNLPRLSKFKSLEHLDLSFNSFSGVVDTQFESLNFLKTLNLSSNSFEGDLPWRFGGVQNSALQELVLSNNQFIGGIPSEVFNYKNLTFLDLSMNNLTGSLPYDLHKLTKLSTLLISSNKLTGEIPSNLSSIKFLSRFAANQNLFNGAIPAGMSRTLRSLDLSYNHLAGRIPTDLLSYPSLQYVDLTFNNLQGPIPTNLSRNIYRLRLSNNKLNGTIPKAVGNLVNLEYLELDENELNGDAPSQLGNCRELSLLSLADNKLQGRVLAKLANLSNLVVLKLQRNNFSGDIPNEFINFTELNTLNLSGNSFSGVLPPSIINLQKLSNLDLSENKFSGSIPNTINNMKSLNDLQLGHNGLSGIIPEMPDSLSIALNLSNNNFDGPIPDSLSNLHQLEILDLSKNSFSGDVPDSLSELTSLTLLNISYNQLSGVLPHFSSATLVDYDGNHGLVMSINTILSPSAWQHKKNSWRVILAVVGAVVGSCLIAATFLFVAPKRFYRAEAQVLHSGENPPQIINGCFITSNSIHRSSIDFDQAMEAVGYPCNITLKTRFTTYYKVVMPSGVSYSVKKLNWTDKIFHSASRRRFGQELEVLGKLSNSNVMVPLAYVLTEDSAYLFYEDIHKGTVFDFLHKGSDNVLDWPSRYSIALGVAQGLTFLHGCTQPVFLLDLTTRSIHLKSQNEPQIGDIELSKVIDPSKSTGSLSTVAGSVGYIPPEYAYTMRVTAAGNVYSFGVILLEMLTGKLPVNEGVELAKWALSYSTRLDEKHLILDSRISRASLGVRSQMLSVLKVALSCVNYSPDARPKMRNVLRTLFNAR